MLRVSLSLSQVAALIFEWPGIMLAQTGTPATEGKLPKAASGQRHVQMRRIKKIGKSIFPADKLTAPRHWAGSLWPFEVFLRFLWGTIMLGILGVSS